MNHRFGFKSIDVKGGSEGTSFGGIIIFQQSSESWIINAKENEAVLAALFPLTCHLPVAADMFPVGTDTRTEPECSWTPCTCSVTVCILITVNVLIPSVHLKTSLLSDSVLRCKGCLFNLFPSQLVVPKFCYFK